MIKNCLEGRFWLGASLLVISFVFFSVLNINGVLGANFGAQIAGQAAIQIGNTNRQLVVTITNQNASTLSITAVNFTLPAGLSFIAGSNITTSAYGSVFYSASNNLTWTNSSSSGLIDPGSFQNFTFNVSGPAVAGYYNITVVVVDNGTAANWTYVSYSSTPPQLSTYERSPATPHEDQGVLLNVTIEALPVSMVVLVWNGVANYTVTSHVGGEYFFNIGIGNYTAHDIVTYYWAAEDSFFNTNVSAIQQFTVANQQPGQPSLTSPANYANISTSNFTFQYLATDSDAEDTLTYYLYINGILNSHPSFTSVDANLTDGFYNWSVVADDGYANSTASAIRNFTIDTIPPQLTIYLPAAANYSSTSMNLNFTYTETNLHSCWYQYNGSNTSLGGCANASFTALDNQQSTLILWANDTTGNYNSSTVTFTVDTAYPKITITSPANYSGTNYTSSTVSLNFAYTEANPQECWYQYNGANTSIAGCANTTFAALDHQSSSIAVWMNDSTGHYNVSDNVTFSVCTESWSCSAWSTCSSGTQARTCSDAYSCGTTANRPALSQSCTEQSTGGGSGGTAPVLKPQVVKSWDNIGPGAAVSFSMNKTGMGFSEIKIEVTKEQKSITITITKLDGKPAEVTKTVTPSTGSIAAKVYQYLSVDARNLNSSEIKSSGISFMVEKSWLSANKINKTKVYLHRYVNGAWVKLATRYVREDGQNAYYTADTPGFSYFAITGEEVAEAQAPAAPAQNQSQQVDPCNYNNFCEAGETQENCPSDCAPPPNKICDIGQRKCEGSALQECSIDGMSWETYYQCDYGCYNGQCKPAPSQQELVTIVLVVAAAAAVIIAGALVLRRRKARKKASEPSPPPKLPPARSRPKKQALSQ